MYLTWLLRASADFLSVGRWSCWGSCQSPAPCRRPENTRKHIIVYAAHVNTLPLYSNADCTITRLWYKFSCSSYWLGENSHNAFPHSRDDAACRAARWIRHFKSPCECLHGLIHNTCDGSWTHTTDTHSLQQNTLYTAILSVASGGFGLACSSLV